MAGTRTVSLNDDGWTAISQGEAQLRVQMRSSYPVWLALASSEPDDEATAYVTLATGWQDFTLGGMTLYGRSSLNAEGVLEVTPFDGAPVSPVGAPVIIKSASIANATSLSAALNLGNARLTRIEMPAAWTAADLTFQVSSDGTTWRDLYDAAGSEYLVKAAASRAVLLPYADFIGIQYLKIRSGTAAAAVAQAGIRTLTFVALP